MPFINANGSENLDGRVQIVLSGVTAGTAYWDDASLTTAWAQTAYNANGTVSDTYALKPAGGGTTPATIRTHLTYTGTSGVPPVLPASTTVNYVNGSYDPAHSDEDLISTAGYDIRGRIDDRQQTRTGSRPARPSTAPATTPT